MLDHKRRYTRQPLPTGQYGREQPDCQSSHNRREMHAPVWLGFQLFSLPSLLVSVASSRPSLRAGPPLCMDDSMEGQSGSRQSFENATGTTEFIKMTNGNAV